MGSTTQRSDAMRRDGVYRWQVVAMLWLVCFFNYADRQAISTVFPLLKEEFGFVMFQLGLIGSALMWVYAAGAPFAGFIADRVKRVHVILGGCIFWRFVILATAWCSRLWQFVSVRALEGFGETCYFLASMSLTTAFGIADTAAIVFRRPAVLLLMLGFLGANFVATIFLTWSPTFLRKKLGYSLWAVGLLAGSVFVAMVGLCSTTPVLIASMTAFGFCKGCYDSGIFASLFDQVEPQAPAIAAGGIVYLISAGLLVAALIAGRRAAVATPT